MNAYNLLDDYQKQRYAQYKKQNPSKARWFIKACVSGEVKEAPKPKVTKKDPLGVALFLIEKNGYTTVAEVMDQSGYSHKKVSESLAQMMESHGIKRFKSEKGQYLYHLNSDKIDTRSTEEKILDLIAEKP